jgi:glutamyl-tRNA synthetase
MSSAELAAIVAPGLEAAGLVTVAELERRHDWFIGLLDLLKVRARTTDDIVRQAEPYFRDTITYDPDSVAKQWKDRSATADILTKTGQALEGAASWDLATLEESLRVLAEQLGFGEKAGKVFQPLRVALTGLAASPGIFDVLLMLGRDRSLARIADAVRYLRSP